MKKLKITWPAKGYFDLYDSDNNVGSLFSIENIMTILSIPFYKKEEFTKLLRKHRCIDSEKKVFEPKLHKKIGSPRKPLWKHLVLKMSLPAPHAYQSLSELELIAIIKQTYDGVIIKEQYQVENSNRIIDIKATYNGATKFIEFLGPNHFEENKIEEDKRKREEIEGILKTNIIEWPYWIPFCENNVRVAFGEQLEGRGAIWGSCYFFGGVSNVVKKRIIELSNSFNAIRSDGIGYFYEKWEDETGREIKPAHPIIKDILNGSKMYSIDDFIPAIVDVSDRKYWLPKSLWDII